MQRLIILDRDGVINRDSPNYITRPQQWQALPGSLEAIARLCRAEYRVVIITNQSGIAKGLYSINTLNRIHQKMFAALQAVGGEISAIFFCPHEVADECSCRKPKPGLFVELADRLRCNLSDTYAVGDSSRDLQAAIGAGAKAVLVETGNGRATAQAIREAAQSSAAGSQKPIAPFSEVPIYEDLAEFVDTLLAAEVKPDSETQSAQRQPAR